MVKPVKLKINCFNKVMVEGYPSNIESYLEEHSDSRPPSSVVQFILNHNNQGSITPSGAREKYSTPITCYAYNARADIAKTVLNPLKLCLVEGKLRKVKGGDFGIVVDYIHITQPVVAEVTVED